jgi:hypothetical protein
MSNSNLRERVEVLTKLVQEQKELKTKLEWEIENIVGTMKDEFGIENIKSAEKEEQALREEIEEREKELEELLSKLEDEYSD